MVWNRESRKYNPEDESGFLWNNPGEKNLDNFKDKTITATGGSGVCWQ